MANTRFLDILGAALSDTGAPLSGAKLYFYESGTSTPKTTYSDAALTTPNANPVVANSAGVFGSIFLGAGNYKVVLTTSADVTRATHDPVAADVTTVSAFMETFLDDANAGAALTTLGVSSFMQGVLDDTTASAAQSTLGLAGTAAWRNAAINGDFRVHQRGNATVTATGNWVADRWRVIASGGSRTAERVGLNDASATAIGRESARVAIQYAATGGVSASDVEILSHRIEGVRRFAGSTVTLSFWAIRTAGSGDMATCFIQNFGTGGSPSAEVAAGGTKHTLTSSWTRYTVSVAIPSVTGKTLGSNSNDYLELRMFFSAGSDYNTQTGSLGQQTVTAQIADVMIEPGTSASNFVARPIDYELAACMRYFETSNPGGPYTTFSVGSGGPGSDGTATANSHPSALFAHRVQFRVPKRAAPTITTYDQIGTASRHSYFNGAWNDGGTWSLGPTAAVGGFFVRHTIASSTQTEFTWQASAEL